VVCYDAYLVQNAINNCVPCVPCILPGNSLVQLKRRTLLSGGLSSVQGPHILYESV
jgi:hypothetical protein